MRSFLLAIPLLLAAPTFAATSPSATQPLDNYLKRGGDFTWKVASQAPNLTTIDLTSQTWQGVKWQHQVRVYAPKKMLFPGRAVLQLGTKAFPWDDISGHLAADNIGATFITVYDVPNQPIFNRTEDWLFGYSLQKMFETGDASWSLAFPMTKTATRAMDAVQAWSKNQKQPINGFITMGFSKRALGAWLASADPRVIGLVSLGYNNLNVEKQAPNQLKEWGEYSPMLRAYTTGGLIEKVYSPQGQKLMATWDPYSFLSRIDKPKYLIDATNNGYWTLDAFDQYAKDLRGPSSLLYVANAGHYMENAIPSVFGSIGAWCRATLEKKTLPTPKLTQNGALWKFSAPGAASAQLFYAYSGANDFRESNFSPVALTIGKSGDFSATIPIAPAGTHFLAIFGEGSWKSTGLPLKLTSRVQIGRIYRPR